MLASELSDSKPRLCRLLAFLLWVTFLRAPSHSWADPWRSHWTVVPLLCQRVQRQKDYTGGKRICLASRKSLKKMIPPLIMYPLKTNTCQRWQEVRSVPCGVFSLLLETMYRFKTPFQLFTRMPVWEMWNLVAGPLGRKEPPRLERVSLACAAYRPRPGACVLRVVLWRLPHGTEGMRVWSSQVSPLLLWWRTYRRPTERFWLPVQDKAREPPQATRSEKSSRASPRKPHRSTSQGGGGHALGMPLWLVWGCAFPLACFREGNGLPACSASTKSPQFNPNPWNLAVSVQTK